MTNNFGLPQRESPYTKYNGIETKVGTTKDTHFGIISLEDSEFIYLKPYIVYENLPREDKSWNVFPRIETITPKAIKKSFIESIEPVRDNYMSDLVDKSLKANGDNNSLPQ